MTKNVGKADRIIRLVAGLALAVGAYRAEGAAMYIIGAAAAVALLTGLLGWCGLYALLGISTCRIDKP